MSQAGLININDNILPPDVAEMYVTDMGVAIPVAHILNVVGSTGVTTSASGNTITIMVSSTGFTWNLVTSISPTNPIQIIAENAYSCQGSSQVTFTLPLAPNFGDTFIVASTTSTFQIAANAGQKMRIGAVISTAGSGTCTSNAAGDSVEFVYMGSNIFQSIDNNGNLTLT